MPATQPAAPSSCTDSFNPRQARPTACSRRTGSTSRAAGDQYAALAADVLIAPMHRAGIDADVLDSGHCGLAADSGVAMATTTSARRALALFAVRTRAELSALVLPGFCCRTQMAPASTPAPVERKALAHGNRQSPRRQPSVTRSRS